MGTTAEKLNYLNETKEQIKQAMIGLKIDVTDNDTFRSYATKLAEAKPELPDYMSAKNFTFDGGACTGYIGDPNLPEIIVPKSYSATEKNFLGAPIIKDEIIPTLGISNGFSSVTFISIDGIFEKTYTRPEELASDFLTDFPDETLLKNIQVSLFNGNLRNKLNNILSAPFVARLGLYDDNVYYNNVSSFTSTLLSTTYNAFFDGTVITDFSDGDKYLVKFIDEKTGSNFKNFSGRIILLNNIISLKEGAFKNSGLVSIIIPNSVTDISQYVFQNCKNLKSLIIPESVERITQAVCKYCSALEHIVVDEANSNYRSQNNCLISINNQGILVGCKNSIIPADGSISRVEPYSFSGCSGLTSITIPEGITLIGSYSFDNCRGLTAITIPSSVSEIGIYAFVNCSNLTEMTILATTPPRLNGSGAISRATTKIYIPAGTLTAYQTATNWSNFADKFEELPA